LSPIPELTDKHRHHVIRQTQKRIPFVLYNFLKVYQSESIGGNYFSADAITSLVSGRRVKIMLAILLATLLGPALYAAGQFLVL